MGSTQSSLSLRSRFAAINQREGRKPQFIAHHPLGAVIFELFLNRLFEKGALSLFETEFKESNTGSSSFGKGQMMKS